MHLWLLLRGAVISVASVAAVAPVGTVAASSGRPAVVSLAITHRNLPASGGRTRITARVRNAETCRFVGLPGSVKNIRCSSGRVTALFSFSANRSPSIQKWDAYLDVIGAGGRRTHRALEITQSAAPPPPTPPRPPVAFLDACAPGPHCFYGPIFATYPTYGNTAPQVLGDCTFAAAANWEQIVLGLHPDPTVIGFEFADAGGTEHGGLPQNSLWTYWRQHGIAGVRLSGLSRFFTDQTDVENAVRSYGALVAELQFVQNTGFAQYTVAAGGHDVVVDGFTPEGPLVVSWGQTLQMTWAQWNSEVVGMWGIAAT
jgi:hypothetical protein